MKVFEFHFNPKGKEDLVFDSFCYEPENVYEKRLGSLFLLKEIKNALPQTSQKFLDNFSSFFKKEFYSSPIKLSPEPALRQALKSANEYLENIAKKGEVSWLGNFSAAILNIKNFDLNFTKVGTIKIFLCRAGQIINIGKNLEFQEIEPYPLKIFGSIVSGKLAENDLVLVFTKDICDFFFNSNLIKQISQLKFFSEKALKDILKKKEKELLKISGIFILICLVRKENFLKEEKPIFLAFRPKTEKFSFKKLILTMIKILTAKIKKINFSFPEIKIFKKKEKEEKRAEKKAKNLPLKIKNKNNFLKIPSFSFSFIKISFFRFISLNFLKNIFLFKWKINWKKIFSFNKNVFLILALIFFAFLGSFVFEKEKKQKIEKIEKAITEIENSLLEAENYLSLGNEKMAYEIYKNLRQEVLNLVKNENFLQEKLIFLEKTIEERLKTITELEEITDPKLLFDFNEKEFIPQKMILFEENFYFFSPFDKKIIKINLKGEKATIEANKTFSEAGILGNSIAFFQKPNLIFLFKNDVLEKNILLALPYSDFEAKSFCIFQENIYFLDSKNGEIIKYSFPLNENKDFPKIWLAKDVEKVVNAKSMSIDGPIWLIDKENKILQYYGGKLKKTIELELFPEPQNFTIFQAKYGLFYILEPSQKRVIVAGQNGKIIKQFQSDKFDNLKDFSVSDTGRTIWLLNGTKFFEVNF